jgi:hypothetical protein
VTILDKVDMWLVKVGKRDQPACDLAQAALDNLAPMRPRSSKLRHHRTCITLHTTPPSPSNRSS